jgi:hypothetical protein
VSGLGAHDLERVNERVQVHELERAIGMRDPMLWDRRAPGSRRIWRNPWISTAMGGAFGIGGFIAVIVGLATLGQPGRDPAPSWVGLGFGLATAALGVVLAVLHGRRIPWWTRARAVVRAAGLPMPTDLDPFE